MKGIRHIESERVRLDSKLPCHPRREIGPVADSWSIVGNSVNGKNEVVSQI